MLDHPRLDDSLAERAVKQSKLNNKSRASSRPPSKTDMI